MTIHQNCSRFYAVTPLWLWPWLWWQLERIYQWRKREGIEYAFLTYDVTTRHVRIRRHSPSIYKPRPWSPLAPEVPRYEEDMRLFETPPLWAEAEAQIMLLDTIGPSAICIVQRTCQPLTRGPPPLPLAASPDLIRGLLRREASGHARRYRN